MTSGHPITHLTAAAMSVGSAAGMLAADVVSALDTGLVALGGGVLTVTAIRLLLTARADDRRLERLEASYRELLRIEQERHAAMLDAERAKRHEIEQRPPIIVHDAADPWAEDNEEGGRI